MRTERLHPETRQKKILCIKACFFSDRTGEIFSPDGNFAATVQKFLSDRMKKYFSPYKNFLPTAGIFPPAFYVTRMQNAVFKLRMHPCRMPGTPALIPFYRATHLIRDAKCRHCKIQSSQHKLFISHV
jgi:hypothetical protein